MRSPRRTIHGSKTEELLGDRKGDRALRLSDLTGEVAETIQKILAQRPASASVSAPAGAVGLFASSSAPTGWLKANGALVSRTTYADLFAAIGTTFGAGDGSTTFALPDLRGEFLRAWDDGRGVDSGRAFGSAQGDQNKAHSHGGATASAGNHTHGLEQYRNTTGFSGTSTPGLAGLTAQNTANATPGWSAVPTTNTAGAVRVVSGGAHTHTITSDGGAEARPRNVALLACIKF